MPNSCPVHLLLPLVTLQLTAYDTYGQATGDVVLTRMAEALRKAAGPTATVGRQLVRLAARPTSGLARFRSR